MNRLQLSESEQKELTERLKSNYRYDARHGCLVNVRTGRAVKGDRRYTQPYLRLKISISGKRIRLLMHRAVWAVCYGRLPGKQIDHINGIGADNRIENLREVSASENLLNCLHGWRTNANTGLPGVCHDRNRYRAKIRNRSISCRSPYEAFFHLTLLGRRFKDFEI